MAGPPNRLAHYILADDTFLQTYASIGIPVPEQPLHQCCSILAADAKVVVRPTRPRILPAVLFPPASQLNIAHSRREFPERAFAAARQ
jgi:hypothetical protein